jgi:prepilin peptidase CpaA
VGLSLVQGGLWAASLAALAAAAGSDLKERIIPNRLVLLVAAAGLAIGFTSWPSLVWVGILAAMFLVCALGVLAHFNWLGGGDVKLIAAASLLARPDRIISLLFAIAFAGGFLSLVYLVRRWALAREGRRSRQVSPAGTLHEAVGESLPYGVAILGGVSAFVASDLCQSLGVVVGASAAGGFHQSLGVVSAHVASEFYPCRFATFCSP